MITGAQIRATRALPGPDQKKLAVLAALSLPAIRRMEARAGDVRGVVERLARVMSVLQNAGVEMIAEDTISDRAGRGVRGRKPGAQAHRSKSTGLKA